MPVCHRCGDLLSGSPELAPQIPCLRSRDMVWGPRREGPSPGHLSAAMLKAPKELSLLAACEALLGPGLGFQSNPPQATNQAFS